MQSNSKVSLEKTANAFAYKNDTQLNKAHFLWYQQPIKFKLYRY